MHKPYPQEGKPSGCQVLSGVCWSRALAGEEDPRKGEGMAQAWWGIEGRRRRCDQGEAAGKRGGSPETFLDQLPRLLMAGFHKLNSGHTLIY